MHSRFCRSLAASARGVLARRLLFVATLLGCCVVARASVETPAATLNDILDEARSLAPLETVIVSHDGRVVAERGYRIKAHPPPAVVIAATCISS